MAGSSSTGETSTRSMPSLESLPPPWQIVFQNPTSSLPLSPTMASTRWRGRRKERSRTARRTLARPQPQEAGAVSILDREPGDFKERAGLRAGAPRRSRPPSGPGTDARGFGGEMAARRMVTGRECREGRPVRAADVDREGAAVSEDAVGKAQGFFDAVPGMPCGRRRAVIWGTAETRPRV